MNLAQVYAANPITVVGNTDLYYTAVGGTTDGAITGASLKTAFSGSSPWTAGSGTHSALGGDGTSVASGNYSLAYGENSTSSLGIACFAQGNGASAGGSGNDYSFAFGYQAIADGAESFAFGHQSDSHGANSFAFGSNNTRTGYAASNSFAFGNGCLTQSAYGVAIGNAATQTHAGSFVFTDSTGTNNTDSAVNQFACTFAGGYYFWGGSLSISTIGSGLKIAEGSNAKQGIATLVGGTVTVANTSTTANSRIQLTIQSPGGTVGSPYVASRIAGTSFTITSTSALDTSVVAYFIVEPA